MNPTGTPLNPFPAKQIKIDALKDIVELKDIDLIVMGTKGAADAWMWYLKQYGTGDGKIRNCPVLAIPQTPFFQPINEIVFPTGSRRISKCKKMHALVNTAQNLVEAPIRIMHLVRESALDEEQQNYKELLESCFEGLNTASIPG